MWIILFVVFILFLVGILILILFEGKVEVERGTAAVIKNTWSGKARVLFPGIGFFLPGLEKFQENVSLKNEAENPSDVNLMTSDGVGLEVDYLVKRRQIGYKDMSPFDEMTTAGKKELAKCVIKATTAISYSERRDKTLTRMVTNLQTALGSHSVNTLFPGSDLTSGEIGKKDESTMKDILKKTNQLLLEDIATVEWGFLLEIDLEDYNLPAGIAKSREDASSAKTAGKAIKDKAEGAGVSPTILVIADALSNLLGGKQ